MQFSFGCRKLLLFLADAFIQSGLLWIQGRLHTFYHVHGGTEPTITALQDRWKYQNDQPAWCFQSALWNLSTAAQNRLPHSPSLSAVQQTHTYSFTQASCILQTSNIDNSLLKLAEKYWEPPTHVYFHIVSFSHHNVWLAIDRLSGDWLHSKSRRLPT